MWDLLVNKFLVLKVLTTDFHSIEENYKRNIQDSSELKEGTIVHKKGSVEIQQSLFYMAVG